MGCDIHAYIEVKEDGQWKYYDWRKQYQIGTYDDGSPKMDYDRYFDDPFYIGRNYNLFAILANVRNGRGFAGIKTGEGFKPIDMPRGLPDNVTSEVKVESDSWDDDGHSHSYLLLSELLDYDWDGQGTIQYGTVGIEGYKEFKQNGKPNSWAGDVGGMIVRNISNAEMDNILNGTSELSDEFQYYTRVQWQENYRDAVGEDWFKTLEELKRLGNEVRLVFWFDN